MALEGMFMSSDAQSTSVSKKQLWAGRIISALPVLLLLFSGVMKLMKPAPVVQGFAHFGYPESLALSIGILELAYPCAHRRSILRPGRSRRAGLGRTVLAR